MIIRFLRFLTGISARPHLVLGRPIPPGLHKWKPLMVKHDHRISAGIFSHSSRSKTAKTVYRAIVWKSFQKSPGGRWAVSTSLFPDELDPALRLLDECRRALPTA